MGNAGSTAPVPDLPISWAVFAEDGSIPKMRGTLGNCKPLIIWAEYSFGRIIIMQNARRPSAAFPLILLCAVFVFGLASACGPSTVAGSPGLGTPTPTPFQPDPAADNSLFTGPVQTLPVATFTPYPTHIASPIDLLPAQIVQPALGESGNLASVTNPLTGLPFSDPQLAERRPIAIKISNSPDYVRPQSGLSLSDVAYEYYIEWGDTRFIAVFYGNDAEQVGPVRSGRFFDEHVLRMYHAFLVYKYSDPREKQYFYSSDFAGFLTVPGFTSCPPFFVGKYARDTYNNVFFNTKKFAACLARRDDVDNLRQNLRSGFFSDEPQPTGSAGQRIYTDYSVYSYNYWDYDPATRTYFRYQEANDIDKNKPRAYAPLSDALTGLPVTTENVVVILAPHTFANQFEADDQVYHIDPIDSGRAFVFRDGLAYSAKWYRPEIDQPLLLTDEAGIPIYLRPGRTFYQIVGETSTYVQDGVDWHFTFRTP